MDSESLINIVKIGAAVFAGISATIALVTEYKKEHKIKVGKKTETVKRLTPWGRLALGFIIISTLIAGIQQGLELTKAKNDKTKAEEEKAKRDKETREFSDNLTNILGTSNNLVEAQRKNAESLAESAKKQDQALTNLSGVSTSLSGVDESQQENLRKSSEISQKSSEIFEAQKKGLIETISNLERVVDNQQTQVELQGKALEDLRNLYLTQYRLDGLQISWKLAPETIRDVKRIFAEELPELSDLERLYWQTAIDAGTTQDRPSGNFIGMNVSERLKNKVAFSLARPQGIARRDYPLESNAWKVFQKARRLILSDSFIVRVEPDPVVFDTMKENFPYELVISGGRVFITVREPGIRLNQLKTVAFKLQALYDEDFTTYRRPQNILVNVLDNKVSLKEEIQINWEKCETEIVAFTDSSGTEYREGVCSETQRISANFDKLLKQ